MNGKKKKGRIYMDFIGNFQNYGVKNVTATTSF